ncbi:related to Dolichol kinase [Zygosaccharomyces bailii]|nr:related to Dolichol kinase [Zygosaccharomyces bailii]
MSNPLPSVPSSGTAAELENKSNRVAHSEETEEADYSVIEAALQPERVLQLGILGLTTHLAYEKYYKMDIEHMDIMNMALIALVSIGVGAYSSFKASRGNIALLPDFNVVYLIFLPTMLSLLFDQRHAAANIALILNYMQISPFYGLPMQMIFIAFHAMDLSVEEKYTYLAAVPINYAISSVLSRISQLKSLDNVDCNIFSILLTNVLYLNESTSLPFRVLKKTLTAFILVVSINYLICMLLRPMSNSIAKSMILFGVFLCGFPYAVKRLLVIDGLDPLVWLINYIANSKLRQTILLIWLCSLTILIPNVLIFKSSFTLNTSRKVWHFLILLLISQPFQMDSEFVKISLAGTIVLFLCVEYLRYLKLEPFGEFLDSRLRSFADYRDEKGPLIISYIYLIIGIATPLLIDNSPFGLISLGVGDSLASIIGGKWGKTGWPGTGKTMEGTAAFFIGTSIMSLIFKQYLGYFKEISISSLIFVCALSGILEGNSVMNDNILIPAFMLIAERILS